MKRTIIFLLTLSLFSLTQFAFAERYGDFVYYKTGADEATLSNYTGKATELIIPGTINGLRISKFEGRVFNENLTSITIPDSITSLYASSFTGCSKLTSINVSADHPTLKSVDGVVFNKDMTKILCYPPGRHGEYIIPDGVTVIGEHAFFRCYNLTAIGIPNSVTVIEESAFEDCSGLANDITLPSSVVSIGKRAFYGCRSLTLFTLSNDLDYIGDYAFWGCSDLISVDIPDSVTSIGRLAFNDCDKLQSINVSENNPNYSSIEGVLFNKDQTELIMYPPRGKKYLSIGSITFMFVDEKGNVFDSEDNPIDRHYTIPGSVTSIARNAFEGCNNLVSITIPDSVITIGVSAFSGCRSLTSLTIPNSVKTIGTSAFYNCRSLTSVNISSSVTWIGDYYIDKEILWPDEFSNFDFVFCEVFSMCYNLEAINVAEDNPKYSSIDGVLFNKDKTELICYPRKAAAEYVIPNDVTYIRAYAFNNRDNLTSVTIPDSVTVIGNYAFSRCTNLKSLVISENVTSIGAYAFEWCDNLASIILPKSLKTIGEEAFRGCHGLTSIVIPKSVEEIGEEAFKYCSLTSITIFDNVKSIGSQAFSDNENPIILTSPGSFADDYAKRYRMTVQYF